MRLGRAGALSAAAKNRKEREKQRAAELAVRNHATHLKVPQKTGPVPSVLDYEKYGKDIEFSGQSNSEIENNDGEHSLRNEGSVIDGESGVQKSSIDYSKGGFVSSINTENINLQSSDQMRLVFRKYPCTLWVVGSLVMVAALYLFYHLMFPENPTLFEGYKEGHWWQYTVALIILLLGLFFCYGGKVESVSIDRREGVLELRTTSIFCRTKKTPYSLKDVIEIRAVKKGHEGVNFYTLHYTIQAEFRNQRPVKILESQNQQKIIKQIVVIRNFVGLWTSPSNVHIMDQSSRI